MSIRQTSTAAPKEKWDLYVGVLVERLPIVSKKFNEIESDFMVSDLQHFTVFN